MTTWIGHKSTTSANFRSFYVQCISYRPTDLFLTKVLKIFIIFLEDNCPEQRFMNRTTAASSGAQSNHHHFPDLQIWKTNPTLVEQDCFARRTSQTRVVVAYSNSIHTYGVLSKIYYVCSLFLIRLDRTTTVSWGARSNQ